MHLYKYMKLTTTSFAFSLLFLSLPCFVLAQSPHDVWYFGDEQGMRFENGNPVFDSSSKIRSLIGSSTMSDSAGNLLFYTNGRVFFDRNHDEMPGITGISNPAIIDVVSLPSTLSSDVYHVYVANTQWLAHYRVDLSQNNGLGSVEHINSHFTNGPLRALTAIKSCNGHKYWLVCFEQLSNSEYAINTLEIEGNTGLPSIKDRFPIGSSINRFIWEMTASPQGDQIAIVSEFAFNVFDFDPICGKVLNQNTLPLPVTTAAPLAACYSPNGKYLYASYASTFGKNSGLLYQLDRYELSGQGLFKNQYATDHVITGMQNGPDGRLYALANYQAEQKAAINRIENPDAPWPIGTYTEPVLKLQKDWLYHTSFPNYVVGNPNCKLQEPELLKDSFCVGDSIRLEVSKPLAFDSLYYINRENNSSTYFGEEGFVVVAPKASGSFLAEITWNKCSIPKDIKIPYKVMNKPLVHVNDTIICNTDSLLIQRMNKAHHQQIDVWSNDTWIATDNDSIVSDSGTYRLRVNDGFCESAGRFQVQLNDPLYTELAETYTFCEKAGNTVLLDAGKGFKHYRWFPTMDSTQWIEVKSAGDYYVIVKDSRGCSGRGNTVIASDCNPLLFIPNAFSPNADGLNDVFSIESSFIQIHGIQIFDRWGSIVYYSNGEQNPWDGTKKGDPLPTGVYLYVISYEDLLEKDDIKSQSGTLHLIR